MPLPFLILGFTFQAVLLVDFTLRWVAPEREKQLAKVTYGLMVVIALAGLGWMVFGLSGSGPSSAEGPLRSTQTLTGPIVMAVWAGFGFWVDGVKKIEWRSPPRWNVFVPYVTLYLLALFSFLMPLLEHDLTLGVGYAFLMALHTVLNIGSHFRKPKP